MSDFPTIRRAAVDMFVDAGESVGPASVTADERMKILVDRFAPDLLERVEVELASLSPEDYDVVIGGARMNDQGTEFDDGEGNVVVVTPDAALVLDDLFGEND